MKLSVWTYEGPPHVGAMRVATAMKGLHYVLHAPQGDTYADLLFTMIERRNHRPPVTYTTFQARDLGSDTANLFKTALQEAHARFQPEAMIVGASCTAELIQDDPGGLAESMDIPVPVVALELPSYQRKENFGASETFFQLARRLARPMEKTPEVKQPVLYSPFRTPLFVLDTNSNRKRSPAYSPAPGLYTGVTESPSLMLNLDG